MTNDPKTPKNTFYTVYTNVTSPTSDLIWFITLDIGREMVFRENFSVQNDLKVLYDNKA